MRWAWWKSGVGDKVKSASTNDAEWEARDHAPVRLSLATRVPLIIAFGLICWIAIALVVRAAL